MAERPQVRSVTDESNTAGGWRGRLADLAELGKLRLSFLVLLTTALGYFLAAGNHDGWTHFLLTLLGTGLAAYGANALNQTVEAERDALMRRTQSRPVPSGRMTSRTATAIGLFTGLLGPALLVVAVHPWAGLLALLTLLIYVGMYTPLKYQTSLNTLVGALVGALPPMIGWVAATGHLAFGAWVLAGILLVWQIPHFLSLAWVYRDEYAAGGYRMVPGHDPTGRLTAYLVVLYALILIPVSLMLFVGGVVGWIYVGGAVVLGVLQVAAAVRFERTRTERDARRVFAASIIYLTLLLACMAVDRRPTPPRDIHLPPVAGTLAEVNFDRS